MAEAAVAQPAWVLLAYLVAGVCFILALRGLSGPETSRRGNRTGMIGMAMGHQRNRLGLRRIDPRVGRANVDAFGKRLYPGTETGHHELYG